MIDKLTQYISAAENELTQIQREIYEYQQQINNRQIRGMQLQGKIEAFSEMLMVLREENNISPGNICNDTVTDTDGNIIAQAK